MENQNKKSKKWLFIGIAIAVVVLLAVWCVVNAIVNPKTVAGVVTKEGAVNVFNFSTTFTLFVIAFLIIALGYLLGGIDIKGVTLGTAGVFLVAILFGFLCTLVPEDVPLLNAFAIKETSNTFQAPFKTWVL